MKTSFKHILILGVLLSVVVADRSHAVVRQDVVGYWTMQLRPGFNLVAFPVLPDDPSPASVIGDRLGAVEISTWDRSLGDYRWTRYNPETGGWVGNLFILHRGTAYWINLREGQGDEAFIVTGHPEVYTQFRWVDLGSGWKYYAPIYGKSRRIDELPPDPDTQYLFAWNSDIDRFELAVSGGNSWADTEINRIEPDQGYIVHRRYRELRRTAYWSEDNLLSEGAPVEGNQLSGIPPWPLLVGNAEGLPVCYANGDVCNGSFIIRTIRESVRIGVGGELETFTESMGQQQVAFTDHSAGYFKVALSVGQTDEVLNPGDRVYIEILGNGGASTRSTSFEVPSDEQFITDLNFPNPLIAIKQAEQLPLEFSLSTPYPNPFNDRFRIELTLPATAPVKYTIYDLSGRVVRSVSQPLSAGSHRLTVGADGMATGIYLFEVSTPSDRSVAKIAYVR